ANAVEREPWRLPQRFEDARRRLRQVRRDGDGDRTKPVGEVVEDGVELGGLGAVLRELPGGADLDLLVEAPHRLPDLVERPRDVEAVETLDQRAAQALRVDRTGARGVLQRPVAVAG